MVMEGTVLTLVAALVLVWLAWKVIRGVIKFGVIALISAIAIYLISTGAFG